MPASGSGGSVIGNCGVAGSPGGAWRGFPLLAWGWSIPVSLVREDMLGCCCSSGRYHQL